MNMPVEREGFQPAESVNPQVTSGNGKTSDPVQVVAAPPKEQEEFRETWPVKVKLIHKPIFDQDGREVKEMVFREPTAGDINRYGNPVLLTNEFEAVIDPKKMSLMMAALSGILSPMLDRMDPRDWNSCAYRWRTFFLPEPVLAW